MTDAIREQIVGAVVTALEGVTGFSGLRVARDRDTEVKSFPTLVVVEGGHRRSDETHGLADFTMTLMVEGYVAAKTPATLGPAINALYAAAVAALVVDHTLGGLAVDTVETGLEREIDREPGHAPRGSFALTVEIRFFTDPLDVTAAAP